MRDVIEPVYYKKIDKIKLGSLDKGVVPRVGVEPTRPKPPDFESSVSTNSTTEAQYVLQRG